MKRLVFLMLALAAVAGCSARTAVPVAPTAPVAGKAPIYSVERDDNKVAISFDAAWGSEYTRDILDILDQFNLKTTFFVVKFWVEDNPEAAREIINRGHEIGNHSATHPEMGNLSAAAIESEIMTTHNTIKDVTGFEAKLFRPPFGHYSQSMLSTIAGLSYYAIQWDVDSLDWKERGIEDIVLRVTEKTRPGSIILFHNNGKYTAAALPLVLQNFKERNLQVVPISQLIHRDNFEMDHEGRQKICTTS